MSDLKPCPCCGGEAAMQQTGRDKLRIQCKRCAIKREQRALRFSLEWLEQKMTEAWNSRTPPEGMALVPREITAETGHKAGMMSEFSQSFPVQCDVCEGDGQSIAEDGPCANCEGAGEYVLKVNISWINIKAIHKRIVEISEGERS